MVIIKAQLAFIMKNNNFQLFTYFFFCVLFFALRQNERLLPEATLHPFTFLHLLGFLTLFL